MWTLTENSFLKKLEKTNKKFCVKALWYFKAVKWNTCERVSTSYIIMYLQIALTDSRQNCRAEQDVIRLCV